MSVSKLTEQAQTQALDMLCAGVTMDQIYKETGVYPRRLKRLAASIGITDTSYLVRSTRMRCDYLEQRLRGLSCRQAGTASGISVASARVYEQGSARQGSTDAFVPAGPQADHHNGLMETLTILHQAEDSAAVTTGHPSTQTPRTITPIDPYRPVSARFLSPTERETIADLYRAGQGVRSIARVLGRSPGTVSKVLSRNSVTGVDPDGNTTVVYHPHFAQRVTVVRRLRPKTPKLVGDAGNDTGNDTGNTALRDYVIAGLRRHWSPEQIAGRIRIDFPDGHPDAREMRVSAETIYDAFYLQPKGGLKALGLTLPSGRKHRRPRNPRAGEPNGFIGAADTIDHRPAEAENRDFPGHWEGDLIVGTQSKSAVITLVERFSRFTLLGFLPGGKHDADTTGAALQTTVNRADDLVWSSITWDRGREMAGHRKFTTGTQVEVFFADPHSPWQRGTNENTNGRIRRFLPKGTDLTVYGPEDLEQVENVLNHTPRKCLGFRTPAEVFYNWLVDDGSVVESA